MDNEKIQDYNESEGNCSCGDENVHGEDCGCGCGDHEPLMVDLEDENGNAVQCEVVDGFAYKENEYAIVENHENGSVYLFKVVGEGDMGELVIPDDAEFDEVSEYYASLEE
ncbi:MAG: DUF1292 domain-containing protein [Clostridium sp.]|jgi:uncharacterized protein YrzB (UPF0473 family)|uniref:DUF1292 domain-containing protein n=1 Tax=Clostridium sp. TaxID=1506 RepID=UPI0025BB4648|nr:DUF1292 domain-containing protein [Clostridium sp.]MCH3964349.1 DUF1292 domain-containing protein [Clostridium sp.]MCI1715524.1 DUF1292 domain-containing protein [Clostridium sp.]MCI1799684.1 DUF1292 domain-containing protein [Clostridium sp.]MCI1813708.1 DUF1292 domain-containing protein [Clostridium sp.]MCI1870497.1 DUF1292 domain-containing protein [Clostridium sp.]